MHTNLIEERLKAALGALYSLFLKNLDSHLFLAIPTGRSFVRTFLALPFLIYYFAILRLMRLDRACQDYIAEGTLAKPVNNLKIVNESPRLDHIATYGLLPREKIGLCLCQENYCPYFD